MQLLIIGPQIILTLIDRIYRGRTVPLNLTTIDSPRITI
jgi:hypothetical protein